MQFLTEHLWLLSEMAPTNKDAYAERCVGRFCGEPVPGATGKAASVVAWAGWWLRTLFVHLPTRLGIIVGDLPAHDWHHLCGFVKQHPSEWPSAIYARQRAIDSGEAAGMERRELWGLAAMTRHVLSAMSQAPSIEMQTVPAGVAVSAPDLNTEH